MDLGQYDSLGEYCGSHTASSVFLILVFISSFNRSHSHQIMTSRAYSSNRQGLHATIYHVTLPHPFLHTPVHTVIYLFCMSLKNGGGGGSPYATYTENAQKITMKMSFKQGYIRLIFPEERCFLWGIFFYSCYSRNSISIAPYQESN